MTESVPERLGRYEVLLPIGKGGMATVYLARAAVVDDLHREFAVKLLHPQYSHDESPESTMLIEEARLAARIRHPNVVSVVEVGQDPSGTYLVMDYVEGETLASLFARAREASTPLPTPIVGRILIDMLAGLHAAHALTDDRGEPLHVVHRDVSPQNVLVGVDGITRLTDFGIARAVGRAATTSDGLLKGKAGYMSPEQALGHELDRRCDVWAAGVLAWELLANQRMHGSADNASTLLRVVMEPPRRLRSVQPSLAGAIDDAVASALEPKLSQRCPTAAELRARLLSAWAAGHESVADVEEVAEYVREQTRERRIALRERVASVVKARTSRVPETSVGAASDALDDLTIPIPGKTPTRSRRYVVAVVIATACVAGLAFLTRAPRPLPPATNTVASSVPLRTIHLRARVPITRVLAGDRVVLALATPALAVDLFVPGDAVEPLTVVAADGRTALVPIASGRDTEDVALEPIAASVACAKPPPRPQVHTDHKDQKEHKEKKAAPTSASSIDLAPPPYHAP